MFQRVLRRSCLAATLLAACLIPADVQADVTFQSLQIGLDGMAKPGVWTRARATLSSTTAVDCQIELQTPDPNGNPVTYPGPQIQLQPGSAQTVDVFFKPGRLQTTVTVRAVGSDDFMLGSLKRTSSTSDDSSLFRVVRNATPAWIVVGQLPGSPGLAAKPDRDAIAKLRGSGVHITELQSPADLPVHPRTLSAWRAVIVSGQFDFPASQSDALEAWVRDGGHVLLAIGTHLDEFQASPLARWAQEKQEIVASSISDLSRLELLVSSFADQQGGGIPLEDRRIPFFNPRRGVIITQSDGDVIAGGLDSGVPNSGVLTRHSFGFGRISLFGVDLNEPPLARWRGLDSFITSIVDVPVGNSTEDSASVRISHTGITELATQLQNGMEQFDVVSERSKVGRSILGLTLLYLLLIGPLDWYVVHRVLKRPNLTWFTFPTAVLLAGFLAGASARASNGTDLQVNTLEIVDIDTASGTGRQNLWTSIYSPTNRRARISMTSAQQLGTTQPVWLSWSGIPESYFGGMYRMSGIEFGRSGYQLTNSSTGYEGVDNLPIPIWSDRVLQTETGFSPKPGLFTSKLQRGNSLRLTQDSSFTHNLPVPLQDWLLVDRSHIYYHRLDGGDLLDDGALPPGKEWTPGNDSVGVQALKAFLTGSRFQKTQGKSNSTVGDDYRTTQANWDTSNTDLATLVRMLTLHDMSGGTSYTGVTNAVLPHLELSDCLKLDRVILLGRIELPCADLRIDGESVTSDRHETFIRVLLPVKDGTIGDLLELD